MRKYFFIILITIFTNQTKAQETEGKKISYHPVDKLSLNLGIGIDMSGFGGNVLYYLAKPVGVFGGIGYLPPFLGYGGGLKFRYLKGDTLSRVVPFMVVMYGTNLSVEVENADYYNRLFKGFSTGLGIDTKAKKDFYWSLSIYKPFRTKEALDYIEKLKNDPALESKNPLLPIGFSFSIRTIIK